MEGYCPSYILYILPTNLDNDGFLQMLCFTLITAVFAEYGHDHDHGHMRSFSVQHGHNHGDHQHQHAHGHGLSHDHGHGGHNHNNDYFVSSTNH